MKVLIVLCLGYLLCAYGKSHITRTALDDYVSREESVYGWTVIGDFPDFQSGCHGYLLNVTSQTWKTEKETNNPVWFHYVIVVVPHERKYDDSGIVIIDNGQLDDSVPNPDSDSRFNSSAEYAISTGAITIDIKMIPNQYLECEGDPPGRRRREDDLIAWTWRRFLEDPSDPDILLQLPMTKGVVKSMDAVTEFMQQIDPVVVLDKFMLSGSSKRGWTSYLVAAVDSRVFAITPSVISCVSFQEIMNHQFEAYGGWSFSNIDYYNEGISANINHPNMKLMLDIIDPSSYASRLTMPKLITSAVGDEHFMPDDSWYFWDALPGQNYLWMLEGAGHSLNDSPHAHKLRPNRVEFFHAVRNNIPLPNMVWERSIDNDISGSVTLYTASEPKDVTVVWALSNSTIRRDFREHVGPDPNNPLPQEIHWNESHLDPVIGGLYRAKFDTPQEGWLCFFIKTTYAGPRGTDLYYTTEVNILPDSFHFDRCDGPDECDGPLV